MTFPAMPDPGAERRRDHDRWHPERETLELAAAGAQTLITIAADPKHLGARVRGARQPGKEQDQR